MLTIKELREEKKWSQTELADKLKVSMRTIQNYEADQSKIPLNKLHKIYQALNVDLSNSMLVGDVAESEIMIPKDGLKVPIPYYNIDFAGGWKSDEIFAVGNPDFYINNPEFERSEFACNLVGHSISRRIPNKAIIGLKLIEDWQTYFPTNELYAVVMKNDLRTVKIIKRSKENKKILILLPDALPEHNRIQYEPEEVPIEFIQKFYQIVAWAQVERIAQ